MAANSSPILMTSKVEGTLLQSRQPTWYMVQQTHIMSAGHVFPRPTVFIAILVFTLLLGSTSEVNHYNLNCCTVVRRFLSLSQQQGKLPILKWSKHSQTTIAMPDNQCFVAVNAILPCSDIHPQPGPTAQAERGSKETTIRAAKSHTSHATKNCKHLMSGLKVIILGDLN